MLGIGRHFRLPNGAKLVVGRHKQDNDVLEDIAGDSDLVLTTPEIPGPAAVLPGDAGAEDEHTAARVVARYSDAAAGERVRVLIKGPSDAKSVDVKPLDPVTVSGMMI